MAHVKVTGAHTGEEALVVGKLHPTVFGKGRTGVLPLTHFLIGGARTRPPLLRSASYHAHRLPIAAMIYSDSTSC